MQNILLVSNITTLQFLADHYFYLLLQHQFQDSHHMLIVQWSGFDSSDTVVVLTRDIVPNSESTSYLYISNNYGVSYTNESNKLSYKDKNKVSKHGLIERYYSSPVKPKWVSIY